MVALALLAVAATAPGSAPGSGAHATRTAASAVTIMVRVDARGRGTFVLRGALDDGGAASARRAVVNGRLDASVTLAGAKGRIVLTSQQRCGRTSGTWGVVSGTRAYEGLTGRGTTTGPGRCARPLGPAVVRYRGAVELPPLALATPGSYGGRTGQDAAFLFDVTPDGRAIANVLLGQVRYECLRSDGLRMQGTWGNDSTYTGPFPIADDRTFTFRARTLTIAGRFTQSGAEGTIAIASTLPADAQGRTATCSGTTGWTVTTPPPAPRRALAGTYCGFARGGGGVCVDVTPDGRQARNVRAEVVLTCGLVAKIPLRVTIAFDQPMPLRTDLSFSGSWAHPFEGSTLQAGISGTFDPTGGLTGTVGLGQPTIVRDGARHICRGNGIFTATLQR